MGNRNQHVITSKRALREKALSSASPYVSEQHDLYLNANATDIVDRIAKGEWTASKVLEAYIARAAVAQAATNCLTEVLFEEARKEAWAIDKEFATTGLLRGPLHGVPVSFKDQYSITGYDSTIGFTQWANKPREKDAFVRLLLPGAIIIVKTNVPQTMFAFECCNPLWGCTTNPWNNNYTCGGSSGGEAALLALGGSALGIGSDIGGSLRIPASYCGIYSFKPVYERVSGYGCVGPNPGYEAVRTSFGPMARSVQDCELFCRTIFGQQDPSNQTAPLPYREVLLPTKLRFGYYTYDGVVRASPANKRAVLETVDALRKQGHECIEFRTSLPLEVMKVFVGLATADGYERILSHLGPDPKESSMFLSTIGPKLPGFVRNFVSWAAETFLNDSMFASVLRLARKKTVGEYIELADKRNKLIAAWNNEIWEEYNFDGIIAPVQALPTLPHGGCAYLSPIACATILYNIVDSPVGTIPVTRVDPAKDGLTEEWTPGAGGGSPILESRMYKGTEAIYNPGAMKGIPVGVQIVGKRWEDEKVIAMMHVVDAALGPRDFGPGSWRAR
ncbi:hypothetical protein SERLADRAFT_370184 [Serpula lacrymans var. lacrymans S7.9]|uniref:amidase n=1 Tax=Serpula lacrymans var. lacrymans (strain S7.9) TaxID=578457 RepID=F8NW92_SERL9|nr:uncharacterized protein SERLADRAFT_370184 [Serpula lacrymans var. lacrymans S7.9]EGO24971.1 hypothetical protein SERLADRAFT_370184 [Serpula lacrymans var. lacrymans S7.9]